MIRDTFLGLKVEVRIILVIIFTSIFTGTSVGYTIYILNYKAMLNYSIIISGVIILFCTIVSYFLFKKVSDPLLKKLAYTDYLTGLKNRTAFELNLKRYDLSKAAKKNLAIAVFDLNDLKVINDTFGHLTGDIYIKKVASVIDFELADIGDHYRIGGDEFVSLITGTTQDAIDKKMEIISERLNREKIENFINCGIAYGWTFFDKTTDNSLKDTFSRADANMYSFKNNVKRKSNQDNNLNLPNT